MSEEPIKYLSLAALARRADRAPQTVKRRLISAGITPDALELPGMTNLYQESHVAELVKLLAAEPEPVALDVEPKASL